MRLRRISKCYLRYHEVLIVFVLIVLLSFMITKLPVCNQGGTPGITGRRSSRLDVNTANEDEEDDDNGDKLGAKDGEFSKNIAILKHHERGTTNNGKTSFKKVPYGAPYEEIDCIVNDEYTITARRQGNDTFIPFSFLEKHFEIDGKLTKDKRQRDEKLEWHHSTAKVYNQRPYKSNGTFMTFEHYHVEQRTKVKYISGLEGKGNRS